MKYFILILVMLTGVLTTNATTTTSIDGGMIYKSGYVKQNIGFRTYQRIKKVSRKITQKVHNFQKYYLKKKAHQYRVIRKKVKKFVNHKILKK